MSAQYPDEHDDVFVALASHEERIGKLEHTVAELRAEVSQQQAAMKTAQGIIADLYWQARHIKQPAMIQTE